MSFLFIFSFQNPRGLCRPWYSQRHLAISHFRFLHSSLHFLRKISNIDDHTRGLKWHGSRALFPLFLTTFFFFLRTFFSLSNSNFTNPVPLRISLSYFSYTVKIIFKVIIQLIENRYIYDSLIGSLTTAYQRFEGYNND